MRRANAFAFWLFLLATIGLGQAEFLPQFPFTEVTSACSGHLTIVADARAASANFSSSALSPFANSLCASLGSLFNCSCSGPLIVDAQAANMLPRTDVYLMSTLLFVANSLATVPQLQLSLLANVQSAFNGHRLDLVGGVLVVPAAGRRRSSVFLGPVSDIASLASTHTPTLCAVSELLLVVATDCDCFAAERVVIPRLPDGGTPATCFAAARNQSVCVWHRRSSCSSWESTCSRTGRLASTAKAARIRSPGCSCCSEASATSLACLHS